MSKIIADNSVLNFEGIVRCDKCDFLSVQRIPEEAPLNDFYQQYYANTQYVTKEDKKIRRATRRIKRVSNATLGKYFSM